jgi:hypothetical protein
MIKEGENYVNSLITRMMDAAEIVARISEGVTSDGLENGMRVYAYTGNKLPQELPQANNARVNTTPQNTQNRKGKGVTVVAKYPKDLTPKDVATMGALVKKMMIKALVLCLAYIQLAPKFAKGGSKFRFIFMNKLRNVKTRAMQAKARAELRYRTASLGAPGTNTLNRTRPLPNMVATRRGNGGKSKNGVRSARLPRSRARNDQREVGPPLVGTSGPSVSSPD